MNQKIIIVIVIVVILLLFMIIITVVITSSQQQPQQTNVNTQNQQPPISPLPIDKYKFSPQLDDGDNNIYNWDNASLDSAAAQCDSDPNCKRFIFIGPTASSGEVWFKGKLGPLVPNTWAPKFYVDNKNSPVTGAYTK